VVHITGHPEAPSRGELVDVHFIKIGFTEASAEEAAFLDALLKAVKGQGAFCSMSLEQFAEGPSYIDVGGWLGDQEQALRLFGLIQHYGLGDVFTPATLGVEGDEADELAGRGMVMATLDADKLREAAHA
jgi:hypothetical protein